MGADRADTADTTRGGPWRSRAAPGRGLSARSAAERLGVNERTIRRAIARGDLAATKHAGAFQIQPRDLARYRARLAAPAATPAPPPAPDDDLSSIPGREPAPLRLLPVVRPPRLPPQLTSLTGRQREIETIAHMLGREDVRLMTLTGPGGVGKTRLALQIAARVAEQFPDGVAFVPLAPLTDPALVLPAIVQTLDLPAAGQRPATELLPPYLRSKRFLLVLDNCEHVVAAGPEIAALLVACHRLTVLTTSRVPLHVSGEREVLVPPLSLPDPAAAGTPAEIGRSEAVSLFVARGQDVAADFTLTDLNARDVAAICRRLDGLPLAIELAAAHCKVLSPSDLLHRLERRLPLLTGGPRDQPARLQTMRAAIAWSYDLLSPAEQALYRRLSVFAGGCTLDAVEWVMGNGEWGMGETAPSPMPHHPIPITLDGLASLVDKSLLRPVAGPGDSSRYIMLETIREFGLEQLAAAGEDATTRDMHAAYYLALAERGEAVFTTAGHEQWRGLMEPELDNFRSAQAWFIAQGAVEPALRLLTALEELWWIVGEMSGPRRALEEGLAAADDIAPGVRTRALILAAGFEASRGDFDRAMPLAEEASTIAREHADAVAAATATELLGRINQYMGRGENARRYLADAVARHRANGDRPALGRALCQLATLGDLGAFDRPGNPNDLARSTRYCEEALEIFRELGDSFGIGAALIGLGNLAYYQHDYARACALSREALAIRWELHDVWEIPATLEDLADIACMTGQPASAARIHGAAEVLREMLDKPIPSYYREEYEQEIAVTRAALGEEAFAAEWDAGRSLPVEQAVAEALAITVDESTLPPVPPARANLTRREIEVLRLLAAGQTDREIAAALDIAYRTATTYVTNILAKINVRTRTAAASYAVRHDLD